MPRLPEFRCTRNIYYGTPGATDLTYREGYYIRAENAATALRIMAERFPHDLNGFTATFFKD